MGDRRWAKALRFLVWFIIVLLLMIATAQKRTDRLDGPQAVSVIKT